MDQEKRIEPLSTQSDVPQTLPYAGLQTPPSLRWRPASLMIASGLYGIILAAGGYEAGKFKQIFYDFKLDLPVVTQIVLWISHVIWDDYLWVVLLPLSIFWPLLVAQFLPVPELPENRRKIVSAARASVILIYLITLIFIAVAYVAPMLALIGSVSGPQKK